MPSAIDKARKRLTEIEQEMAEIRHFLAMYERFESASSDPENELHSPESGEEIKKLSTGRMPVQKSIQPRRKRGLPGEIAQIVERVIRETGFPMTRGQIVDALQRRDVEIPAQDQARYIGTIMWRHKSTFQNLDDGRGYWLRGEPLPRSTLLD